jgi:hypothetical protein
MMVKPPVLVPVQTWRVAPAGADPTVIGRSEPPPLTFRAHSRHSARTVLAGDSLELAQGTQTREALHMGDVPEQQTSLQQNVPPAHRLPAAARVG